MNNHERILYTRQAGYVDRCHTHRIIGTYTVAQHSFNMLTLLKILHPNPSQNLIWKIIGHDLPELWTGDIPHTVKQLSNSIKEELEIFENNIFTIIGFESDIDNEEEKWLKGLDMLELFLFCYEQEKLGNKSLKNLMDRIYDNFNKYNEYYPLEVINYFFSHTGGELKDHKIYLKDS